MIGQAGRDKAIIRDPSLAQVISSDASDVSAIPHKTDDLDMGERILHPWTRLRALWTAWSVVVRVHSSAWKRHLSRRGWITSRPDRGPNRSVEPETELLRSRQIRPLSDRGKSPENQGFFSLRLPIAARHHCSVLGHWPNRTICRTFRCDCFAT